MRQCSCSFPVLLRVCPLSLCNPTKVTVCSCGGTLWSSDIIILVQVRHALLKESPSTCWLFLWSHSGLLSSKIKEPDTLQKVSQCTPTANGCSIYRTTPELFESKLPLNHVQCGDQVLCSNYSGLWIHCCCTTLVANEDTVSKVNIWKKGFSKRGWNDVRMRLNLFFV